MRLRAGRGREGIPTRWAGAAWGPRRLAGALLAGAFLLGCASPTSHEAVDADDLEIVDCLLPGRLQQLGTRATYLTPRRPARLPAVECRVRGGEYTARDRASLASALAIWLPRAQEGDPEAQTRVGEMYERGLGVAPDYEAARVWYEKAAAQGWTPAMLDLGQLYDRGLGVAADPVRARSWYRRASGLDDGQLDFVAESAGAPEGLALPGPSLEILDPPLTARMRGIDLVVSAPTEAPAATREIVGRVRAPAGLARLEADGRETPVNELGIFRIQVAVGPAARDLLLAAVDRRGQRTERRITLGRGAGGAGAAPGDPAPGPGSFGRYFALVVSNEAYRELPPLASPHEDADALSQVLAHRYGFQVTRLRDATRYDVMAALNRLRARLTEDDNLLLYYAGHGELDEVNDRGHWLPVDAEPESSANWISNVSITDVLNAMSARHVLVVSDSCYSGSLTRSSLAQLQPGLSPRARRAWEEAMAARRSRTALTSGGLAPVLDTGEGQHSVFAGALLEVLRENREVLAAQQLHRELAARVTWAAQRRRFEQLPQYAPIRFAGHDSGEFFFVPRPGRG